MLIWCPTRDASWTYLWSWPVHGAEMKSASMRRADGWSYGELKMLPLSSFRALASIFQWIEDHKQWPACLSQWFLVLLRKTNIAVPTWADLRPITVAASLYRLWARVRASRILGYPPRPFWGFVSDFLDYPDHRKTQSGKPINLHDPLLRIFWYNCYPPGN